MPTVKQSIKWIFLTWLGIVISLPIVFILNTLGITRLIYLKDAYLFPSFLIGNYIIIKIYVNYTGYNNMKKFSSLFTEYIFMSLLLFFILSPIGFFIIYLSVLLFGGEIDYNNAGPFVYTMVGGLLGPFFELRFQNEKNNA